FVESEMPLPGIDPASAAGFAAIARRLVAAAEIAARSLSLSVRDACFERDTKFDAALRAAVYERFWTATEDRFFTLLREAAASDWEAELKRVAPFWQAALRTEALRLFDQAAPLDPGAASFDPRKIVQARLNLVRTLSGYGAQGTALFKELELPEPEPKNRGGRRRNGRGAT
ncbi:MAG: type I-E CRISPR-associated protein Cse1/CasA, partial [Bradyrhizobium sp.]